MKKLYVLGIAGALIAIAGDTLLGYSITKLDPVAGFGIIREGHGSISLWRPAVSLVFAMIAFTLYLPALWEIKLGLSVTHPKSARIFWWLSLTDSLGWGLLHAAYCWPIYGYRLLLDSCGSEVAGSITASLMNAIFPFALFYVLLSTIPFGILCVSIMQGKTVFSRWSAFCTPLCLFVPLYILYYHILPPNSVTYTVGLGIMNQCMLVMYVAFLVSRKKAV